MRRFLTFLTLLVVVGCGSSNDFVATNPVNPGAPTTTGSIQVEQTLQRAVTTFVTDIRYTGILPNQSIGYGPETRPKAATTLLESVPTTVTSLRLEYLNGDVVIGRFEIPVEVVAGQVAVLSDPAWLNVLGPDPSFSQGGSVATGTGPTGVAAGDFNNDGRPDVAVANSEDDGVTIHLGDGNGSFGAPTAIATGNIAFNVVVGDLNGDANQDLVVANYGNEMAMETGDISILLGNGDGTFTAAPTLTAENQPIATAIADFNGDGDNDLAICNYESMSISTFIGNGDGTFGAPTNITVGPRPHDVIAADLNNDGRVDLAVANEGFGLGGGDASTLLGNGDGTFGAPAFFPTGRNPRNADVVDVNGDGILDMLTGNFTTGNCSVLLGNGDGTLGLNQEFDFGGVPLSIIAGDFNGDGRPDVAAADSGPNQVIVLSGVGDGTFTPGTGFAAGAGAIYLDKADFNLDGKLDIAVVGFGSPPAAGNLNVLLGQ